MTHCSWHHHKRSLDNPRETWCEGRDNIMVDKDSLKTIAKGGIVYTAGRFGATLLQFISGVIVIRAIEKPDYGLLSLGQVWLGIAVTIASLGMGAGLPRIIAKAAANADKKNVNAVVSSAIWVVLWAAIVTSVLFYLVAGQTTKSHASPRFFYVLTFFALMIVPTVLINTLSAIFRGFEQIEPEVMYNNIIPNTLRILLLIGVVIMGMKLQGVLIVNVFTVWLTLLLFIWFSQKHIRVTPLARGFQSQARELTAFSLPLMGVQLMGQLINWVPMLVIGFFHPPDIVGLYNAPTRLATLFPIPLTAMATLYLPIATKHYEIGNIKGMRELYETTTKWSFLIALPLCLAAILDNRFIVTWIFGDNYINAGPVLVALAIGSSVHTFLGPNGMTLLSFGNRRIVFWSTVLSTCIMATAALILVPMYGAWGAALSFATATAISNISISILLNHHYHIHPFTPTYVKPVLFILVSALALWGLFHAIPFKGWYMHVGFYLIMGLSALASPIITRSLTSNDLDMVEMIELRLRKKSTFTETLRRNLSLRI